MARRKNPSGGLIVLAAMVGLPLMLFGGSPKPTPTLSPSSQSVAFYEAPVPRPQLTETAPQAAPQNAVHVKVFVSGRRVPMRSEPDAKADILDRVDNGLEVAEIQRRDAWVLVEHPVTARRGWISAKRITLSRPPENQSEKKRDEKIKTAPVIALSAAAITAILLRESQAEYHSHAPCACPSDRDRAGRACGKRSAWSRPGGYAPLCFASDVTPAMIAAFRDRRGTQEATR